MEKLLNDVTDCEHTQVKYSWRSFLMTGLIVHSRCEHALVMYTVDKEISAWSLFREFSISELFPKQAFVRSIIFVG